ncbi:MAG: hypothetical protein ABI678_24965, partial [Kofleriaceae bacterium]
MRALLLAVLLAAPTTSAAPAKKAPPPKPTAADAPDAAAPPVTPAPTHSEGDYGGVKPGVPPRQDHKVKRPPTKGTLSWIGFEAKDGGGAEIFLQSVAPFEVAQRVDNGALVVDLGGLDKLGQNTWREVDARFFDTPIA